jgi:choline kinase
MAGPGFAGSGMGNFHEQAMAAQNAQQSYLQQLGIGWSNIYSKPGEVVSDPKLLKTKESKSMFKAFREYLGRHSDIVFTVFLVMIADKVFFHGALKGSVKALAEKLISKAHTKLGE